MFKQYKDKRFFHRLHPWSERAWTQVLCPAGANRRQKIANITTALSYCSVASGLIKAPFGDTEDIFFNAPPHRPPDRNRTGRRLIQPTAKMRGEIKLESDDTSLGGCRTPGSSRHVQCQKYLKPSHDAIFHESQGLRGLFLVRLSHLQYAKKTQEYDNTATREGIITYRMPYLCRY